MELPSERTKAHTRDAIDAITVSEIPFFQRPLTVESHGSSAWAHSYRIRTTNNGDKEESYFMKVSVGDHGGAALRGEFESTLTIHNVVGDFIPEPLCCGAFTNVPNTYYYICKFYELSARLPEKEDFCPMVALLHKKGGSPNGKFGFHVTTYNGDLPQENGWTDTWEEFFVKGFKHMLDMNIQRGGPWEEMEMLKPAMLSKVIPRLLRPMETGGRSIRPVLVHGDLWCGNTAIDRQTNRPLIYDPASFYAHNEYELGDWRPERNKFSPGYFSEYKNAFPVSEPADDFDDRNALYCIRFDLHAAALFPDMPCYRELVIKEMKKLIDKFPGGYEDYHKKNLFQSS